MGTSTARWGMGFAAIDGGQTEAEMWVEVDLRGIMRALPSRAFKDRIQRVMDIEMDAIKAALESHAP
jgi:mRNA-degrading endonuclease toxin of MazEF toxin-antitoxin module